MPDKSRRKELQQQYAERGPQTGGFALRNTVTGEVWVGVSKNLDKQKNGLWGRLASGVCFNKDVQASWNKSGAAAFTYEILEHVSDPDPHVLERELPERAALWREQLKAGTVKGT